MAFRGVRAVAGTTMRSVLRWPALLATAGGIVAINGIAQITPLPFKQAGTYALQVSAVGMQLWVLMAASAYALCDWRHALDRSSPINRDSTVWARVLGTTLGVSAISFILVACACALAGIRRDLTADEPPLAEIGSYRHLLSAYWLLIPAATASILVLLAWIEMLSRYLSSSLILITVWIASAFSFWDLPASSSFQPLSLVQTLIPGLRWASPVTLLQSGSDLDLDWEGIGFVAIQSAVYLVLAGTALGLRSSSATRAA